MERIEIQASRRYEVLLEPGLRHRAGALCREVIPGNRLLLLTDTTVEPLYAAEVRASLEAEGFEVLVHAVPAGEASKNPTRFLAVISLLAEHRFARQDGVLALGGGVVGDLGGFCAATYLRGIGLVQMPTTLLACVDSSVGGKTAVDLPQGKNLLGAFYQPWRVLCDAEMLRTLPAAIYADGMAEVIKYGMIDDAALFATLERGGESEEAVIRRCVEIKARLVAQDEHDCGCRQLLNFGHTAGHAVESCSDYALSHGSAVAIGMAIVTRGLEADGRAAAGTARRLEALLQRRGLLVRCEYSAEQLWAAALSDKKRENGGVNLIAVPEIGRGEIQPVSPAELRRVFERGVAL